MQCVYIWMKKYRNYEQQGFNFGGPLRFDYDEESKKLFIQSSPFHIENFFNPFLIDGKEVSSSTITNVTAIIGENGTGKSSLLEYMIRLFSHEFQNVDSPQLIVFRDERDQYAVYHSPGLHFDLINPQKKKIFRQPLLENDPGFFPFAVYYSNIFDTRRMPNNHRFMDLSTNRMMENHFSHEDNHGLNEYHMKETELQLKFIKSKEHKHSDKVAFKLPEKITIFISEPADLLAVEKSAAYKRNADVHFYEFIRKMQNELDSYYENRDIPKKLTYYLASRVLNHIVHESEVYRNKDDIRTLSQITLNIGNMLENIQDSDRLVGHDYISHTLSLLVEIAKQNRYQSPITEIISKCHELMELIMGMESDILDQKDSFELPVTDQNQSLDLLIELYTPSVQYDSYLQFKWPGLSSGEISLLNLYSRFYDSRDNIIKRSGNHGVLVLIDEGEALFHPQWQKQLVSNLVAFFSDIFQDKRVQIVLTSNSPFIASDLPKTNIIFLKNIDGRSVSINELDDLHQTFAANIHTLLSHSFFLHDGLIGTFARRKINEVINLLVNQGREEIMEKKQEIEALISIIGEPIIRTKLTQLLQEKITLHGLSLEDRVAALEARLAQQEGGNPT